MASLLCQYSIIECRSSIPLFGKVNLRPLGFDQETSVVFLGPTIIVLTDQSLQIALHKPDGMGWTAK